MHVGEDRENRPLQSRELARQMMAWMSSIETAYLFTLKTQTITHLLYVNRIHTQKHTSHLNTRLHMYACIFMNHA
jgi:hypothetical protein